MGILGSKAIEFGGLRGRVGSAAKWRGGCRAVTGDVKRDRGARGSGSEPSTQGGAWTKQNSSSEKVELEARQFSRFERRS
eukprot:6181097-Pleurochrysis_carterae.AAC.1